MGGRLKGENQTFWAKQWTFKAKRGRIKEYFFKKVKGLIKWTYLAALPPGPEQYFFFLLNVIFHQASLNSKTQGWLQEREVTY